MAKKKRKPCGPQDFVEVELFNGVEVGLWYSLGRFRRWVARVAPDQDLSDPMFHRRGSNATTYRLRGADGVRYHCIVFPLRRSRHKLVYHECLHAALYLMDSFGVGLCDSSEEVLTYLQGLLAERVIGCLKKAKRYAREPS